MENNKTTTEQPATTDSKFENISDNGSEISDEGYRSLGVLQTTNSVAASNGTSSSSTTVTMMAHANENERSSSLHSQQSTEDADLNGKFVGKSSLAFQYS